MQPGDGELESDKMFRNSGPSPYNTSSSLGGSGGGSSSGGRGSGGDGAPAIVGRFKGVIVVVTGLLLLCLFVVPSLTGKSPKLRGAADTSSLVEAPEQFEILLISDLDKKSKVDKKYKSVLQHGLLTRSPSNGGNYSVSFDVSTDLFSGHNEAGRGMELSEILTYQGELLTVDDRTGIVFQIVQDEDGRHMAPRYILPEGNGQVDKGMKLEWATVKDGTLVLGSFGKEFTNDAGFIVNTNNNWVIFVDEHGGIARKDWTSNYNKMREKVNAGFPGYMIHEAGAWSSTMNKWVFMPRRISSNPYNDVEDEKMGSNTILICDEDFQDIEVKHAGNVKPTHGFSSFKFIPGTQDQVVVALKSEEREATDSQNTFIMVFNLNGQVLLEETEVPGHFKFEGVEILPVPLSQEGKGSSDGGQ